MFQNVIITRDRPTRRFRFKEVIACCLALLIASSSPPVLRANQTTEASQEEFNLNLQRSKVIQIGSGKKVTVFLSDGRMLRGTIQSIGANDFSLHQGKSRSETVPYNDIRSVNAAKSRGPTIAKIVLITGAAGAALVVLVAKRPKRQTRPLPQGCWLCV